MRKLGRCAANPPGNSGPTSTTDHNTYRSGNYGYAAGNISYAAKIRGSGCTSNSKHAAAELHDEPTADYDWASDSHHDQSRWGRRD